jgi:hypothetical protein
MPTKRFLTENDVDYLEKRLSEVFVTKGEFTLYRSELMRKLDEILGEIKTNREEHTVLSHQVQGQEKRITSIEASASSS